MGLIPALPRNAGLRPGTSQEHRETRQIDDQRSDRLQMDAALRNSGVFYKIQVLIFHFVTNSP
jgi:hypothetical protein